MARVIAIHEITLKPGVSAEEVEQLAREVAALDLPGMKTHLAKGTRGARKGQYATVIEIDSVERRNQLFPSEGTPSEEVQQHLASAAAQELSERWNRLASGVGDPTVIYTDYEVLGG